MNKATLIERFEQGLKGSTGNYFTDGQSLYLFGNKIAEHRPDGIYFTLAGWNSTTTKQAVNRLNGVSVHSKQGVIKNFDKVIEADQWYKVNQN